MIYLDPLQLGWDPLIKSWMENELPPNLNDEHLKIEQRLLMYTGMILV
jgi:hypothetical protein